MFQCICKKKIYPKSISICKNNTRNWGRTFSRKHLLMVRMFEEPCNNYAQEIIHSALQQFDFVNNGKWHSKTKCYWIGMCNKII